MQVGLWTGSHTGKRWLPVVLACEVGTTAGVVAGCYQILKGALSAYQGGFSGIGSALEAAKGAAVVAASVAVGCTLRDWAKQRSSRAVAPVPKDEVMALEEVAERMGENTQLEVIGERLEIPEPTCALVFQYVREEVEYRCLGSARTQDGLKDLLRALDREWNQKGLSTSQKCLLKKQAICCYFTISDDEHRINRYLTTASTVSRVNAHNAFLCTGRYNEAPTWSARFESVLTGAPPLAFKRVA